MQRVPVYFPSAGEWLAGEIILPEGPAPFPAVLLIGGTISDTRDGDPGEDSGVAARHGMLRVMAEHLAASGIASLRWDKRGIGESTGPDRLACTDILTDADDAEQALRALAGTPQVDVTRIAVLGESAGAQVACLLASRTALPAAYVLQGALYDSIPDMLAFNYDRVRTYAARGPEAELWIKQVAPQAYGFSLVWRGAVQAASRGEEVYESDTGGSRVRIPLRRLKTELGYPPADQFHLIQKPALVIQGEYDLNVPPDNCLRVAQALREAGNPHVTLVVVPHADHSMQLAPDDLEIRTRERISFASFARPYSQFFLHALAGWLLDQLTPLLTTATPS
jgi:pimeloyl-ACP methyl ester carboxylesterase